jgi:hypothetical protein
LANRFADVVNVKDFGAVGNGITDDTNAIQAAATSGKPLCFSNNSSYLITGQIVFAEGSVIYGNHSKIISNQNTPNNASHFIFGAKSNIYDLEFNLPSGAFCQRFIKLNGDTELDGCSISSVDQINQGDDNLDGAVQIYNSDDTRLTNFKASGFDKPIFIENSSRVFIDSFEIKGYTRGVNIRSGSHISVSNGFFNTPSGNAGPNPGDNAIGGDGEYISIENITIENTGEHGIYFANADYAVSYNQSLSITNVSVIEPGQCGIKVRGYNNVRINNVSVTGCSWANALGTNEDSFRFEACSNLSVISCNGWKGSEDYCGWYGVYINGCRNVYIIGCSFENPFKDVIRIESNNNEPVNNICINSVFSNAGDYAINLNTLSVQVSSIFIDNFVIKNPRTGVLNWNAAGGEGDNLNVRLKVQGAIPSILANITAGLPYWDIFGTDSNIAYSSTKQQFLGTPFTNADSNNGALHVSGLNATVGVGQYTNGVTFGGPATNRRRAAIAGWQPTSDPDQGGLVFLTKGSTNSQSDALEDRIYIDHVGNVILNMNSSVTPQNNNQLMFEATSNTSLTFKFKGSDGVVRSGSIALT